MEFDEIVRKVENYHKGNDLTLLRQAYEFAASQHSSQKRLSGVPFLSHLLEVTNILADLKLDTVCLASGLLHDIVEDTPATIKQVKARFGPEVGRIVEGVTKINRLDLFPPQLEGAEILRKLLLAMVDDIRVMLVKLADRVHNMRTLQYLPPERRLVIANETMDVYAPIAHRLGLGKLHDELEDLAFQHLEPAAYAEVAKEMESRRKVSGEFMEATRAMVGAKMEEESIPARVEGRIKRLYSVWQKLKREQISIDEIYDLVAIRIITDNDISNCYAALGAIHNTWRPIPGKIQDRVSTPQRNLYQSLHTTVIGPHGQPFEVQIRTEEMHRIAEEGIAAHWRYKEGSPRVEEETERFAWLRYLVEWRQENPDDSLSTLKIDLYPEDVYTLTPKGKVIVLPRDATPIDFAYAIHSEVGDHCVGARVNGRIVPLNHGLRAGDIVQILTDPYHNPRPSWLSLAKTRRARRKIRRWLRSRPALTVSTDGKWRLKENADIAQGELDRSTLSANGRRLIEENAEITQEELERVAFAFGFVQVEDLYVGLAEGKFSVRQVLEELAASAVPKLSAFRQPSRLPCEVDEPDDEDSIEVAGFSGLLVHRASAAVRSEARELWGTWRSGKGLWFTRSPAPMLRYCWSTAIDQCMCNGRSQDAAPIVSRLRSSVPTETLSLPT